jgi:hypothetical protein
MSRPLGWEGSRSRGVGGNPGGWAGWRSGSDSPRARLRGLTRGGGLAAFAVPAVGSGFTAVGFAAVGFAAVGFAAVDFAAVAFAAVGFATAARGFFAGVAGFAGLAAWVAGFSGFAAWVPTFVAGVAGLEPGAVGGAVGGAAGLAVRFVAARLGRSASNT